MYALNKQWSVKHIFLTLLVAIVAVQGLVIMAAFYHSANATDVTAGLSLCPAEMHIAVGTPDRTTVTGNVDLFLAFGAAPTVVVDGVEFVDKTTGISIGVGRKEGSGPGVNSGVNDWRMPWLTTLSNTTAKTYDLNAIVTKSDQSKCYVPHPLGSITVTNSTAGALTNTITTGVSAGVPLSANTQYTIQAATTTNVSGYENISNYVKYDWTKSGGITLNYINNASYRFVATVAGSGYIKATPTYGGITHPYQMASFTVVAPSTEQTNNSVTATPTPSPSPRPTILNTALITPTPTPTPVPSPTPSDSLQMASATASQIANRTLTKAESNCIKAALGDDRYKVIADKSSKPTPAELEKIKLCFDEANNILPTIFVPLDAGGVKGLAIDHGVRITSMVNGTISADSKLTKVIAISGKTGAFKTVYIYVFSEPLVMTTTADKSGNWSYELKNPLQPGQHEVYAVVAEGDGQYKKSNPFGFIVGTAQASAENPDGYSLDLKGVTPPPDSRSILLYILISVGVLVLALAVFVVVVLRRNRYHKPAHKDNQPPFDPPNTVLPSDTDIVGSPPAPPATNPAG